MSRLGPTGLAQLLTNIKTWVTTKLGNYVTTNTTQTITGKKLFTNAAIQLDSIVSMSGSTMFIDTSAAAPRGEFPAESHRVGRIYIGDNTSYNGAWFIVDPTIDTNKAYYRMVTNNPDNTDSTRFSITWDGSKTGARCRKNVSHGDLLPSGNNTYNLGADDLKWDIGYIHNLIGSNKENASEDANNYYSTTSGSHMTFYTTTNGGTKLSNVPAAVNTHLESRTIKYLSSSDWIVEQICHNSFGLYYRKGTNGTWEDWKTFAFTNSNITGTAANVTGTVAIANGGTGATTRLNAVKALTNESVGTPTHFLAITTNYAKAGYTTVAQAKTVLGITGDMGSHSDSEYVHKTGDESISGAKTFSNNITISGTYLGTEASTNERTNIYLLANRDTADASGAYISRFRQNRTQGAMKSSDVSYISFDFLENSARYTRCFTMGLIDWDSDGVPQTYYLTSPNGKGSLGTAATAWNKVYANSYYLGTTAFTDKFVTTDTAQTITGVKTLNSDTLVANQGNAYRIANSAGTGYGVFQRVDGSSWYLMVTAQNDALGTWTTARPATMSLSTGVLSINGNAATATQFSANTTVTLTGDVTGTASSKAGWSVATTLANSGVTAGNYGPSADASPAHSGTFTVPSITVDAKGRITAASTKTITLPSDNNTDTKVTQTVTTANSGYPVLLCATANATTTGTTTSRFSAGLTVNTRYSSIYITNKYDTANTKGVRNTSNYNNGILYFRSYDATQMGTIRCESNKGGYQQIYMMATNYIKDGAIDPEGTATTCSIAVRVRDNGSKTIYTDGSWENSLTPYANETYDLGTSSLKWLGCYCENFYGSYVDITGKYIGNEAHPEERSCLYLKSNRDTDGQSGIYFSKFRQNVAQGALTGSSLVALNLDVLENSVRTNGCISIHFRYFENDVPTKMYFIPKESVTSYMGTSGRPWTNAYITNLNLNGNTFDPTSIDGIGTTRLLACDADSFNSAGDAKPGSSLYDVSMMLDNSTGYYGLFDSRRAGEFSVMINSRSTQPGTWKVLHDTSVGAPQDGARSFAIAMWVRIA